MTGAWPGSVSGSRPCPRRGSYPRSRLVRMRVNPLLLTREVAVVPLVDLNPFHWLGSAAKEVAADGFTAMMMGLWSAAMWLLQTVFGLLDRFVTPNVQDPDLRHLYEVTVWVSLVVALTIAFGQVGLAVIRHDGRSFGTLALGVVQYGLVLCGWIAGCGVLIAATAGLTSGLLHTLLDANDFSGYAAGAGFVDQVSGTVEAATLGVCALFVLIPASFGYLLIMMVRCATLLILTATLPIVAAGSLGEGTKAWLWKSVRWFLASCLTAPLLALVLGLGVQIAHAGFPDAPTGMGTATTSPGTESATRPADPAPIQRPAPAASAGDQLDAERARGIPDTLAEETFETSDTAANVGMSVVGCVILLIGAFAPLALFRVLAFVDPGTASGASFRTAMSANGGVAGLIGHPTRTATRRRVRRGNPDGTRREDRERGVRRRRHSQPVPVEGRARSPGRRDGGLECHDRDRRRRPAGPRPGR